MTTRKRTIDLALDYVDRSFGTRFLFPIKAGRKFPPLFKDNLNLASNDPEQLRAWENQWPGCNWGVSLAKSKLMVADVDTNPAKGKLGQQTFNNLDLEYNWPETEMTMTPSGGFHMIYEGWEDERHPAHIMAIGENGIGKDIDCPNYLLIPGCTFDDGTSYTWNEIEAVRCPEWIYDIIRTAKTKSRITNAGEIVVEIDQDRNITLAIDYLKEDAEPSIQGSAGDLNLYKAAAYLKDIGISQQLGAELLNEYFNPRCEPPWDMEDLEKKMAGAYAYSNQSKVGGKTAEADFDGEVEEPVEPMGNFDRDTKTYPDKKTLKKNMKSAAKERKVIKKREAEKPDDPFRPKTKNAIIENWVYVIGMKRWFNKQDPRGNNERDIWDHAQFCDEYNKVICPKTGKASDVLLRMPKGGPSTFYRVNFKPGGPLVSDFGQSYNLYRAPDITEVEGDITWWNEHLEYLFPDEVYRNHLLNWMAWLMQNLDKKPKHALIIQGEVNGTGKSFIGRVLTRLIHASNVSIVPQNGLSGRFNAWALQCKLILIEELRASDKRAVKEALHDIITEDRISIEKKGVDSMMIDNCFGVMAFTNDDAALDLDNTDRRYLVIRTDRTEAEARAKSASGYFNRLFAKLDDPDAMGAILYSLMKRDLKAQNYDGQQPAPMTEAKAGMKEASKSELEHHLSNERENWPLSARLVSVDDVIASLPKRLESKGFRLHHTIKRFLINDLGGRELGQCTVGGGRKTRLYAINGSAGILSPLPRAEAGRLYEADKAANLKNLPPEDLDIEDEFGQEDDVQ